MIKLKKQHKRTVSSGLYVIEKSIDELLCLLMNRVESSTYGIIADSGIQKDAELISKIFRIKKALKEIVNKYSLTRLTLTQSQLIKSKKTTLELYAEELLPGFLEQRYGKMEIDNNTYRNDINKLINAIKSI
ncbi:MAG: hypothetical protein JW917_00165 [Ignavibacteria bacterium]|nr:hypothetical protein [Ignavibacteria bacterium]